MGEQVGAGSLKKDHSHRSVLYRTDMLNGRKRKVKPVMLEKAGRHVNLLQQGSAVPYNWFLPVISGFEQIEFAND